MVVQAKSGAGIKQVSVPIWSKANQSDLVWYPTKKQADGSYVVHMNIKNHKYHTGKYTTHVYAWKNNGTEMAINLGQTNIQGIKDQLSAAIKNVNQQNGTYDIVVNSSSQFGVREVKVPIWSTPNQSDLVWYKAQKQADGSYVVHMNIKNHKNHRGTYMTHVYMYNNRGQQTAIALNNTNLPAIPDTLKAQIKNVNKEVGSYDVVIQAASQQGIARVEVPTWSTANQSDLVWYKATKQSDGSYIVHVNIKNHKNNRGNYTSHVYLWHPDGSNTAINIGQTDLTKPIQEQPKPTEQPGKTDNQQSGNANTGNTTEPTKPTEQPGKTEEPQVRELDVEKIKSEIVRLVNNERLAKGLSSLNVDSDLEDSAKVRSVEIQSKYDHVRPDGSMYDTVFSKDDREISENANQNWHIAGLSEEQIAETLFTSWKNSPNHYKNMLVNRWTRIGIGISFNSTRQGVYAVQIFSIEPVTLDRNEDGNIEVPLN
ncbi:GBS Bsp-like repeat-containing protein [Enterococcus cecorum]